MFNRMKIYTLARPRLKKIVGWFLIILGLIGLIMPIIPGLLILIVAFELIGIRLVFLDRLLKREPVTVPVSSN